MLWSQKDLGLNSVSAIFGTSEKQIVFIPHLPSDPNTVSLERTIFPLVASLDGNTNLGAFPFPSQAGTMTVLGLES